MKHQQQTKRKVINWPQAYFTAEAIKEPFEDVSVVTLKSYYVEKLHEIATDDVGVEDPINLMRRVRQLIEGGELKVYEHVKVSSSGIRIVIDAETVDDDSIWTALDMLASALDLLDGSYGKVPFGRPVAYGLFDIPALNLH